jgi:hypothetical protein
MGYLIAKPDISFATLAGHDNKDVALNGDDAEVHANLFESTHLRYQARHQSCAYWFPLTRVRDSSSTSESWVHVAC